MKKVILLFILCWSISTTLKAQGTNPDHSQIPVVYNSAYVKALYAKYPPVKSDFCPDCMLWANPYYVSIADVKKNYPVCEHAIVTASNVQAQEAANIPRSAPKKGAPVQPGAMPYSSVFSGWNVVPGGLRLDNIYTFANTTVKKPVEFAYGHCVLPWILAARDQNGSIFSDTETFGEFLEWQGQNVGTMIATEDTTRLLLGATLNKVKHQPIAQQVDIWAGCVSSDTSKVYTADSVYTAKDFKKKGITKAAVTLPDAVWKILKFNGQTVCYWMPNRNNENKAMLVHRHITYNELINRLGFDPEKVLN